MQAMASCLLVSETMFSKKLGIFFSVTLENLTITSLRLAFVWFCSLSPIQHFFSHVELVISGIYDINVNKCRKNTLPLKKTPLRMNSEYPAEKIPMGKTPCGKYTHGDFSTWGKS